MASQIGTSNLGPKSENLLNNNESSNKDGGRQQETLHQSQSSQQIQRPLPQQQPQIPQYRGSQLRSRGSTATHRLKQDYLRIIKDPVPYVVAHPLPSNILEWHYVVRGPESTPYEGGVYHGKLQFPSEFPFKPPSIMMLTPNGRFKTNTRLCLSISDYHPDTWNPAWSVSTILTGLLSFMVEKNPTMGSIETSDAEKRALAARSGEYNLQNKTFRELFPDIVQEIRAKVKRQQEGCGKETNRSSSVSGRVNGSISAIASRLGQGRDGGGQGLIGSALSNIIVIVGFAAFMFTVRYVIQSMAASESENFGPVGSDMTQSSPRVDDGVL